jgi:methionine biosynthesis protein MetW
MNPKAIRLDHDIICGIVEPESKVLDLGCGNGDLIYSLARNKGVKVQGIERDEKSIRECVRRGLSVFHGDIEGGLVEYPDCSFDYVILNQSMQEVKKVDLVIQDALRVGRTVIVSFPNFAYIGARLMLFFRGKAPITKSLPYLWYDTPNVRFLSITDFRDFCAKKSIKILASYYLGEGRIVRLWPNLFALNAIFVFTNYPQESYKMKAKP